MLQQAGAHDTKLQHAMRPRNDCDMSHVVNVVVVGGPTVSGYALIMLFMKLYVFRYA